MQPLVSFMIRVLLPHYLVSEAFLQPLKMPSLTPPPSHHPLSQKQAMPTSLNQTVIPKQAMSTSPNQFAIAKKAMKQETSTPALPYVRMRPRRTNPAVWFGAVLCLIFSLLLIFFGIATLIVYLVVKPKNPVFDVPAARLNLIYFDSPENFNGDFAFLANFSNPNPKIDVRFEYGEVELYFSNSLISKQAFQPFTGRRREARLVAVHMISSLVYLPTNVGLELQKQVQSNRVAYDIRGTFRVRANLGLIHFSYWLHARCLLEMSSPPTGVLLAKSCRTKR